MLTADLVRARRKGNELALVKLDADGRTRALATAAALLEVTREYVGRTREELEEAWATVDVEAARRTREGGAGGSWWTTAARSPWKLVARCLELRRGLFLLASKMRRELSLETRLDRDAAVAAFAAAKGLTPEGVEAGLYADYAWSKRALGGGAHRSQRRCSMLGSADRRKRCCFVRSA